MDITLAISNGVISKKDILISKDDISQNGYIPKKDISRKEYIHRWIYTLTDISKKKYIFKKGYNLKIIYEIIFLVKIKLIKFCPSYLISCDKSAS